MLVLFTENFNAKRYKEIRLTHIPVADCRLRFQQDSSSIHNTAEITNLFEWCGARILDLPSYSHRILILSRACGNIKKNMGKNFNNRISINNSKGMTGLSKDDLFCCQVVSRIVFWQWFNVSEKINYLIYIYIVRIIFGDACTKSKNV